MGAFILFWDGSGVDYRIRWQLQRRKRQRKRLLLIPALLLIILAIYGMGRQLGRSPSHYWHYQAPFSGLPHFAVTPSLLYVAWPSGQIEALRTRDGRPLDPVSFFSCPDPFNANPLVVAHVLYIGSDLGILRALEARTGQRLWQLDTGAPIRCQPLFAQGYLYVGNEAGQLFCLRPDGVKIWQRALGDAISGQPAFWEGLVIAATIRGLVYACEAATGRVVWRRQLWMPGKEAVPEICFASLTAAPPLVLIGGDSGYLHLLDARSGQTVAQYYSAGLVRQPAAANEAVICFGSTDGWLRAISREGKQPLWAYPLKEPVVLGPVIDNHIIYAASPSRLVALQDSTGRALRIWKGSHFGGTLTVAPDAIYIGTSRGEIFAFPKP